MNDTNAERISSNVGNAIDGAKIDLNLAIVWSTQPVYDGEFFFVFNFLNIITPG